MALVGRNTTIHCPLLSHQDRSPPSSMNHNHLITLIVHLQLWQRSSATFWRALGSWGRRRAGLTSWSWTSRFSLVFVAPIDRDLAFWNVYEGSSDYNSLVKFLHPSTLLRVSNSCLLITVGQLDHLRMQPSQLKQAKKRLCRDRRRCPPSSVGHPAGPKPSTHAAKFSSELLDHETNQFILFVFSDVSADHPVTSIRPVGQRTSTQGGWIHHLLATAKLDAFPKANRFRAKLYQSIIPSNYQKSPFFFSTFSIQSPLYCSNLEMTRPTAGEAANMIREVHSDMCGWRSLRQEGLANEAQKHETQTRRNFWKAIRCHKPIWP